MAQTRPVITFSKRESGMPMPDLLDIQTVAFESLLVPDDVDGERQDISLERVFREIFPIGDVNGKYSLEFLSYTLGEAKYSVELIGTILPVDLDILCTPSVPGRIPVLIPTSGFCPNASCSLRPATMILKS